MLSRVYGIDVSHYQGTGINWTTVKNDGRLFAWAKATEGYTYNDDTFTTNEAHAKTAGVLIGAYHFARYDNQQGTSGADLEASHYWSIASPYIKNGGSYLMPVLDVEGIYVSADMKTYNPDHWGYTKTTFSQWVNQWCNDIKNDAAAAGITVTPVIYTGVSFSANWLDATV